MPIGGGARSHVCTPAWVRLYQHQQCRGTLKSNHLALLDGLVGPGRNRGEAGGQYLFAIGLIGSGLVAIPVLLASTSYAIAGSLGWPGALAKRLWQSEGFYLVLTAATVVSLALTLLAVDPIKLIFWSNVVARLHRSAAGHCHPAGGQPSEHL